MPASTLLTRTQTNPRSTDQSSPTVSDHPEPHALQLSDTQLSDLMRLCGPLAPQCRDALLRILAYELRGRHDVGDGELHRIARTAIRENRLFDPPLKTDEPRHYRGAGGGKYGR
jgi:hypothetical protein